MTAEHGYAKFEHGFPLPAHASPAAIRSCLDPADVQRFDREYSDALDAARESLDLTGLFDTLATWRHTADRALLPDGRVPVRCVLLFGDEARLVTPWHLGRDLLRLPASVIARACDMPANELPGRYFTATGGRDNLHDFRLVNDPRL
ncbi:hypothetical protein IU501_05295 [Nocardia otitidiscaviarum]|uniref:DUF6247 family protein n=1 Tax=Nocardia otitidiscaviarum TaxID=1823 RepID=UPI00069363CF|nr:DUF6247 family protein [Nocardia otitidiscaviarum]MBF6132411.1 hypothetical protein [Nocardia otitidiscaviarum]MBF6483503.1 hypothetical protein [Nocardia otitidiscaviarum]